MVCISERQRLIARDWAKTTAVVSTVALVAARILGVIHPIGWKSQLLAPIGVGVACGAAYAFAQDSTLDRQIHVLKRRLIQADTPEQVRDVVRTSPLRALRKAGQLEGERALAFADELGKLPDSTLLEVRQRFEGYPPFSEGRFLDEAPIKPGVLSSETLEKLLRDEEMPSTFLQMLIHLTRDDPARQKQILGHHQFGPHLMHSVHTNRGGYNKRVVFAWPQLHPATIRGVLSKAEPTVWDLEFCARSGADISKQSDDVDVRDLVKLVTSYEEILGRVYLPFQCTIDLLPVWMLPGQLDDERFLELLQALVLEGKYPCPIIKLLGVDGQRALALVQTLIGNGARFVDVVSELWDLAIRQDSGVDDHALIATLFQFAEADCDTARKWDWLTCRRPHLKGDEVAKVSADAWIWAAFKGHFPTASTSWLELSICYRLALNHEVPVKKLRELMLEKLRRNPMYVNKFSATERMFEDLILKEKDRLLSCCRRRDLFFLLTFYGCNYRDDACLEENEYEEGPGIAGPARKLLLAECQRRDLSKVIKVGSRFLDDEVDMDVLAWMCQCDKDDPHAVIGFVANKKHFLLDVMNDLPESVDIKVRTSWSLARLGYLVFGSEQVNNVKEFIAEVCKTPQFYGQVVVHWANADNFNLEPILWVFGCGRPPGYGLDPILYQLQAKLSKRFESDFSSLQSHLIPLLNCPERIVPKSDFLRWGSTIQIARSGCEGNDVVLALAARFNSTEFTYKTKVGVFQSQVAPSLYGLSKDILHHLCNWLTPNDIGRLTGLCRRFFVFLSGPKAGPVWRRKGLGSIGCARNMHALLREGAIMAPVILAWPKKQLSVLVLKSAINIDSDDLCLLAARGSSKGWRQRHRERADQTKSDFVLGAAIAARCFREHPEVFRQLVWEEGDAKFFCPALKILSTYGLPLEAESHFHRAAKACSEKDPEGFQKWLNPIFKLVTTQ